jgi:hypothetical protein
MMARGPMTNVRSVGTAAAAATEMPALAALLIGGRFWARAGSRGGCRAISPAGISAVTAARSV